MCSYLSWNGDRGNCGTNRVLLQKEDLEIKRYGGMNILPQNTHQDLDKLSPPIDLMCHCRRCSEKLWILWKRVLGNNVVLKICGATPQSLPPPPPPSHPPLRLSGFFRLRGCVSQASEGVMLLQEAANIRRLTQYKGLDSNSEQNLVYCIFQANTLSLPSSKTTFSQ